jgi:hypothetical protein
LSYGDIDSRIVGRAAILIVAQADPIDLVLAGLFSRDIIGGGHAELFGEIAAEVGLGAVANHSGYFIYFVISVEQELGGFFQAGDIDELVRGKVGDGFDLTVEGWPAHVEVTGELLYIQLAVLEVLLDDLIEVFEEELVGFGIGHAFEMDEGGAGEVFPDLGAVGEEVGDLDAEVFGRKGFFDIGIGAELEAFDLGLEGVPGCEEDDGDMAVFEVLFYVFTELEAIHYGHHYVGDDQLDGFVPEGAKRLPAIGGFEDGVFIIQFLFDEFEDLFVVID